MNPIGAISKTDLKKFIAYARDAFDLPILTECVYVVSTVFRTSFHAALSFLEAVPTAELEPITETYVQADEVLQWSTSAPVEVMLSVILSG